MDKVVMPPSSNFLTGHIKRPFGRLSDINLPMSMSFKFKLLPAIVSANISSATKTYLLGRYFLQGR